MPLDSFNAHCEYIRAIFGSWRQQLSSKGIVKISPVQQ